MIYDGICWNLTVNVSRSFEYKFIIRKFNAQDVKWEETPNRIFDILCDGNAIEISSDW